MCFVLALEEDHLDRLVAEQASQHRPVARLVRGLVDVELVRVDRALDDVLAEAVGARDEDHVAEAGLGVQREEHAGGGEVGSDHLHDADRQPDREVVEPLVDPVVDRAVGEQAREAAPAGVEQVLVAVDVQVALLLAGEARGGQVLGRRRAAHREAHLLAVLLLQPAVAVEDLALEILGQAGAVDDVARAFGAPGEILHVVGLEVVERLVQRTPGACRLEHVAVGLGRDREAVGHAHALAREVAVHLAERSVLAPHQRDVVDPDLLEEAYVSQAGHFSSL